MKEFRPLTRPLNIGDRIKVSTGDIFNIVAVEGDGIFENQLAYYDSMIKSAPSSAPEYNLFTSVFIRQFRDPEYNRNVLVEESICEA